ncbi:MAG: LysM peptidoglycan-binding domain-containing protein, partial [Planctomycetota bacterium]|nr:LysM peptidoglycan-binding domain-containing protein [Planctomycetota bacterium]
AIASVETANDTRVNAPEHANDSNSEVFLLEPVQPAWPKVHVVRKGDSLADIAKRYYGPKEGNRRANVLRIFESNRRLLKSPDKIYPGQKLVIPSLWASGLDQRTIESIFPDSMFERVESIGRRHL